MDKNMKKHWAKCGRGNEASGNMRLSLVGQSSPAIDTMNILVGLVLFMLISSVISQNNYQQRILHAIRGPTFYSKCGILSVAVNGNCKNV